MILIPMVQNRTIQIRLTKNQYERIKIYSQTKGFSSLSGYLRHMGLEQDFMLQQKIFEIHNLLMGNTTGKKFKENKALYHI